MEIVSMHLGAIRSFLIKLRQYNQSRKRILMINTKKINITIIITGIVFIVSSFLIGIFLGSDLWYDLTRIRIDFFELFNHFQFYLITDIVGLIVIGYLAISFINKVKNNENGIAIIKNRIYALKKELLMVSVIVFIIFTLGLFIETLGYYNVIFIPIALIIIITATTFCILMERYALITE